MGLVRMEFRQAPSRSADNYFGKDDEERPHDEKAAESWTHEARVAVARKVMLGCNVTALELEDARLTLDEARELAVGIERLIASEHKRLTVPPEPKEVEVPVATYVPDPAPVPEQPKRRRKKRDTKTFMRQAIERRHEERDLFTD